MPDPFLGEIRLFGFTFAPDGWEQCNGQLLPINQNQALFSLLGTRFGGNGQTNFALPNLIGRVAIHQGGNFANGSSGGEETHILTLAEMPSHTHQAMGSSNPANTVFPANNVWAITDSPAYNQPGGVPMNPSAISSAGGGQPHNNMQPYLVLNYCIAVVGVFPPQP